MEVFVCRYCGMLEGVAKDFPSAIELLCKNKSLTARTVLMIADTETETKIDTAYSRFGENWKEELIKLGYDYWWRNCSEEDSEIEIDKVEIFDAEEYDKNGRVY